MPGTVPTLRSAQSSGAPPRGDEAGLVGEDDQLGSVAGSELDHGAGDVGLRGHRADEEAFSDLGVRHPDGDELHHLALAANTSMLADIRAHHAADKPLLAECGGMLYLLDEKTGDCVLLEANPSAWTEKGRFKLDPQSAQARDAMMRAWRLRR